MLCLSKGRPNSTVGFLQMAKPVNNDEITVTPTPSFQTASFTLFGTVVYAFATVSFQDIKPPREWDTLGY